MILLEIGGRPQSSIQHKFLVDRFIHFAVSEFVL